MTARKNAANMIPVMSVTRSSKARRAVLRSSFVARSPIVCSLRLCRLASSGMVSFP